MQNVRRLTASVAPSQHFHPVDDLDDYPAWMPLVHDVERLEGEPPAWSVELRAQVGPFARSKRLRMVRTEFDADRCVVFERVEQDGRDHSPWILRAELHRHGPATELTMHLTYGGSLWGGPILERVLDDQVRRGSERLLELVS